jgi:hypothetical protein
MLEFEKEAQVNVYRVADYWFLNAEETKREER